MNRQLRSNVSNSSSPWRPGLLALALLSLSLLGPGVSASAQTGPSQDVSHGTDSSTASTPAAQSPEKNAEEADENEVYRHSAVVQFLGNKLGMSTNKAASAFEVFNFVVLAVLVGWLMLKTLPKTFRDRTSQIQKRLVDARAATEEASARLTTVESRLSALDGEIAGMRAQAERDLGAEEQRVRAAIEEERQKILSTTEQEIATLSAQARREIRQYAADLAIEQAAQKLVVSAEMDRLLVEQFANRLAGKAGGQN